MRRRELRQHWDDDTDDRVRILLECAPEDSPSIVAATIERAGYAVRVCTGPGSVGCDLDDHGACDLVDGADVVVNLLDGPSGHRLVQRVAGLRRPPVVVTQVRSADASTSTAVETGEGVIALRAPATRRALLDAIESATR